MGLLLVIRPSKLVIRSAATLALAGAVAVFSACGGDDGGGGRASCESEDPFALVPTGSGAAAFTMGLRVNQASDVEQLDSEIGDRVLSRDVFVVNTEYPSGGSDTWAEAVDEIEQRFPCNRVAALNGLDEESGKPGDMFALIDDSAVDAFVLDWEPDTWEGAGRGSWSAELGENLRRIDQRLAALEARIGGKQTHIGIVPDYLPAWDYGSIARVIALRAFRIAPPHHGYQIVQTQPNCGDEATPGPAIGPLAAQLRGQYRPLFGFGPTPRGWQNVPGDSDAIIRHLGFEIAFSTTPNPKASEAVERVGPEQAARCSEEILDAGGAGILYWADPDALKAMLDTPEGGRIRPESSS
ncbi:MAG: hypothetical protein ACXWFN_12300 [Solirubrobacterales bacterium]